MNQISHYVSSPGQSYDGQSIIKLPTTGLFGVGKTGNISTPIVFAAVPVDDKDTYTLKMDNDVFIGALSSSGGLSLVNVDGKDASSADLNAVKDDFTFQNSTSTVNGLGHLGYTGSSGSWSAVPDGPNDEGWTVYWTTTAPADTQIQLQIVPVDEGGIVSFFSLEDNNSENPDNRKKRPSQDPSCCFWNAGYCVDCLCGGIGCPDSAAALRSLEVQEADGPNVANQKPKCSRNCCCWWRGNQCFPCQCGPMGCPKPAGLLEN